MDTNLPSEELFLKAYSRFYSSLRQKYQEGIEKASDKTYAKDYFVRTLFTENHLIPRYSVFYHSLVSTFTHHQKLGEAKPLELTLSSLPDIRELTSQIIEQTFLVHSSLSERLYQLNWLYLKAIEDNNISILELIDTEQRLLRYSDEKVILLLALDQAVKKLNEEFSEKKEVYGEGISDSIISNARQQYESKFTRSQQVLIVYYISQLISPNHKKNVSKCADALHSFLGIPYTQITHSELYKKLLHPLTFSSEKTTLQNLLVVRSFFENMGSVSLTKLIDLDIENIKNALE